MIGLMFVYVTFFIAPNATVFFIFLLAFLLSLVSLCFTKFVYVPCTLILRFYLFSDFISVSYFIYTFTFIDVHSKALTFRYIFQ